jgi:hypothetical protein
MRSMILVSRSGALWDMINGYDTIVLAKRNDTFDLAFVFRLSE